MLPYCVRVARFTDEVNYSWLIGFVVVGLGHRLDFSFNSGSLQTIPANAGALRSPPPPIPIGQICARTRWSSVSES